jgi:exodeoxyribonuclease V alpha subunit
VVIPIHTTHYVMLQRNLLYTGVTRGKKLVCLVGQRRAVSMAINNVSSEPRFSALDQRLRVLRGAHPAPQVL